MWLCFMSSHRKYTLILPQSYREIKVKSAAITSLVLMRMVVLDASVRGACKKTAKYVCKGNEKMYARGVWLKA